jgi:hypothetical protein
MHPRLPDRESTVNGPQTARRAVEILSGSVLEIGHDVSIIVIAQEKRPAPVGQGARLHRSKERSTSCPASA